MRLSMVRRLERVAKAHAARRRDHYLFWGMDETEPQVDARIGAMIASGKAGPNDRFVVFSWRSPADDDDN